MIIVNYRYQLILNPEPFHYYNYITGTTALMI